VLSVWAHPDDETDLAGGVMAGAVRAGLPVTCLSATDGELGTDDPRTWPPDRLSCTRRWETAAAMAVLGVTDHRRFGYPDGGLAALDPEEPVSRLVEVMLDVRPDTTLTFGPEGATFHPDHIAVSRWVGEAWRRAGRPGRLLHAAATVSHVARWGELYERWGVYMTDQRPCPVPDDRATVLLELRVEARDQKLAALSAMRTQTAPAIAELGLDTYALLTADECFVEASRRC
jgi:LmbE family N-acetylglucosaminyl deacetylase